MPRESSRIQNILRESSQTDDLKFNWDESLLDRYKKFIISIESECEKKNLHFYKAILAIFETVLLAGGGIIGFYLISDDFSDKEKLTIWIVYLIVVFIVVILNRFIPDNFERLSLEIKKIRLSNLAERLAAIVVLFDLVGKPSYGDNQAFYKRISDHVPDLSTLSDDDQKIIASCLDREKVFNSSRQTNIIFNEMLLPSSGVQDRLLNATREIVEISGHLFAGGDYSAKIYLKIKKAFQNKPIEILTSFSKFPVRIEDNTGLLGSSWVKARGNPSLVWRCLEEGKSFVSLDPALGPYYKSALFVCLPGRIGVLAITSAREDAFKNKDDKLVISSLSKATGALVMESLGMDFKDI